MTVTDEQLVFLKRHLVDENSNPDTGDYHVVGSRSLSARQVYDILEQRRTDDPLYEDCLSIGRKLLDLLGRLDI